MYIFILYYWYNVGTCKTHILLVRAYVVLVGIKVNNQFVNEQYTNTGISYAYVILPICMHNVSWILCYVYYD